MLVNSRITNVWYIASLHRYRLKILNGMLNRDSSQNVLRMFFRKVVRCGSSGWRRFSKSKHCLKRAERLPAQHYPDLKRVENLLAQISHKAVCRHAEKYQMTPKAVYQMDGGSRDMEIYLEDFLFHNRVMHQLQKGRQVIGIKATEVPEQYQLVVLDQGVKKEQLSECVNFVVVRRQRIDVPEYLSPGTTPVAPGTE